MTDELVVGQEEDYSDLPDLIPMEAEEHEGDLVAIPIEEDEEDDETEEEVVHRFDGLVDELWIVVARLAVVRADNFDRPFRRPAFWRQDERRFIDTVGDLSNNGRGR